MLNFLSAVVYNVLTDLHKWKQNIPSKRRPFYMKFRWDKKYLYWGITALLVIGASICLFFLMFRGANFKDGVAQIISIAMPIIDGLVLAYLLTPVLNFIEKQALRHVFKKDGRH